MYLFLQRGWDVTKIITCVTLQQSDNVFKVKWEKHDI